VEGSEGTLGYAVSSYTPTVTALAEKARYSRPIGEDVSGLFLTCQPNAHGLSPIPGTQKEVQSIFGKALEAGVRALSEEGDNLTTEGCLQRMEEYSSIHLACHGSQGMTGDPLRSRFAFHDGSLELSAIMKRNLRNADLAFLSACQTSTGEETLSDEAVHLAAGMLAAGYRRVVATMWTIGDLHAPEVANDFYDYLWRGKGSGSGFDGAESAYALHDAIQRLQKRLDDSEKSLLCWAPYVHFGY
jgi:CHAT domain-containing protein